MFNLFKKKSSSDKEVYVFGDRSSQYGFFIRYSGLNDEISLRECTLFDRETYEEYNAYTEIPCDEFLALLNRAKKGEEESSLGVTIKCKDKIVKEISFYGSGDSGSANGSGIINLSIDDLIKEIKEARK